MAKRRLEETFPETDTSVCFGYISNISPIKTSRYNNKYFDGEIQTADNKFRRVVCFDLNKHTRLHGAKVEKTPIKLVNIKSEPSARNTEESDILISSDSEIHSSVKLQFRPADQQLETTDKAPIALKFIIDVVSTDRRNITITAKVLSIDEPSMIDVRGASMCKQEIIVADPTGYITLTLWKDLCSTLQVNKSYKFTNLSCRQFCGKKSLTTTTSSQTEDHNDINVDNIDTQKTVPVSSSGTIEEVNVTIRKKCTNCAKKCPEMQTKYFKCNFCAMRQKTEKMVTSVMATIKLKSNSEDSCKLKLQIFSKTMCDFLQSENLHHLINHPNAQEKLEETLLDFENVTVTHLDNVVQTMTIKKIKKSFLNNIEARMTSSGYPSSYTSITTEQIWDLRIKKLGGGNGNKTGNSEHAAVQPSGIEETGEDQHHTPVDTLTNRSTSYTEVDGDPPMTNVAGACARTHQMAITGTTLGRDPESYLCDSVDQATAYDGSRQEPGVQAVQGTNEHPKTDREWQFYLDWISDKLTTEISTVATYLRVSSDKQTQIHKDNNIQHEKCFQILWEWYRKAQETNKIEVLKDALISADRKDITDYDIPQTTRFTGDLPSLETPVTAIDLQNVSKHIGTDYPSLARYFGINEADIHASKHDKKRIQEQARDVLQKCTNQTLLKTRQQLCDGLCYKERKDITDILIKGWQVSK